MLHDKSSKQTTDLFDVIATRIKPPHVRRVMDCGMTADRAEGYIRMAVMRRGVEDEFYTAVPSGSVQDGSIR